MPYPEMMVAPMRQDLVNLGVRELRTAEEVDSFMSEKGTALLVINSVCGCAAGAARPSVAVALQHAHKPDHVVTVFAGQDVEATEKARSYFPQLPPSSPSMVLMRDGEPTHYIPRHRIEGRGPEEIAGDITACFDDLVTPSDA